VQLHVLGVDAQNLKPPVLVRNPNVDLRHNASARGYSAQACSYLLVESAKTTQRSVDGVRAVRGSHDHHPGPPLHAVHASEQSGHNATLNFAIRLLALGSNGVDLVDENNGRGVLRSLGENIAQI
jgi:hypothetical protein